MSLHVGRHVVELPHTRRDRSRGIRDEATACEPEVVSRERTWPPRLMPAVTGNREAIRDEIRQYRPE